MPQLCYTECVFLLRKTTSADSYISPIPVIISLNIDTQNDNTFMSGNIGKYGFVSMHELCCAWCFYDVVWRASFFLVGLLWKMTSARRRISYIRVTIFVNFDTLNGNTFRTLIHVVCNTSLPPCILGTHHPHDDMHINARVRREYCRNGVQTQ